MIRADLFPDSRLDSDALEDRHGKMKRSIFSLLSLVLLFSIFSPLSLEAEDSPKETQGPTVGSDKFRYAKFDNPRDTMQSFMEAMEDYQRGLIYDDPLLKDRIRDAILCFDTRDYGTGLLRAQVQEAAILLKEFLDRRIVLDYKRIPEDPRKPFWRLAKTPLEVVLMEDGPKKGKWLFPKTVVEEVPIWFERVKSDPYLKGTTKGAGYKAPALERALPEWTSNRVFVLAYWQWIGLFLAILVGLTFRWFARGLGEMVKKLASHTETDWDDQLVEALYSPVGYLAAILVWYASLYLLQLDGQALLVLGTLIKVLLTLDLVWIAYRLAGVFSLYLQELANKTETIIDDQIVRLISRSLKIFVIVFGVLVGAQNMGIEVFSLLAGLGIGGLAVALAARDTLANFFGSIMIMLDRPFKVGHWIVVNGQEGTVEDVGFRSTKIRTFYNSLISVPNMEVASSPVDNYGLREFRRIKTTIGVTYDTPPEKIEAFLEGIKNIIKTNPYTRKDYFHVVFNSFGPSSLDILLYFFVKVDAWADELVERQNVFLEIIRLAKDLGVDFAFPTQSLHVETFPEKQAVREPHQIDEEALAASAVAYDKDGSRSKPAGSGLYTPPHREGADTRLGGGDDGE